MRVFGYTASFALVVISILLLFSPPPPLPLYLSLPSLLPLPPHSSSHFVVGGCSPSGGDGSLNCGLQEIRFTPTVQGEYFVSVLLVYGGTKTPIQGAPFTFNVGTGSNAAAANSYAQGDGLSGGKVGVESTFDIFMRDQYDNPLSQRAAHIPVVTISSGGTTLSAVTPSNGVCSVSDNQVCVSYDTVNLGRYNVKFIIGGTSGLTWSIAITYNGASLDTSSGLWNPGPEDTSRCSATGTGYTSAGTAGQVNTVVIASKDKYGNTRIAENADLCPGANCGSLWDITGGPVMTSITGPVVDAQALYTAKYTTNTAGSLSLQLVDKNNGNQVAETQTATINPGAAVATKALLSPSNGDVCPNSGSCEAGAAVEVTLTSRDAYDNVRSSQDVSLKQSELGSELEDKATH